MEMEFVYTELKISKENAHTAQNCKLKTEPFVVCMREDNMHGQSRIVNAPKWLPSSQREGKFPKPVREERS